MATLSSFKINQTALGTVDVSRRDIVPTSIAGTPVELEADNAGLTYLWEVIQPPGSAVVPVNFTAQTCTIAAEQVGGYIAKLTVNAGLPTESITRLYFGIGMLINGTRYPLPAITETIEDNSIAHPEYGWFEKLYTAMLAMSAGIDLGYTWRGTTADGVATEIFIDGTPGNRAPVPASSVVAYDLVVTAYKAPPHPKGKTWRIEGAALRDNADNTSLVDVPVVTILSQTDASGSGVGTDVWDAVISVNDGDDTMVFTVTGDAATTIVWEARSR
jgi:hypothetical protein